MRALTGAMVLVLALVGTACETTSGADGADVDSSSEDSSGVDGSGVDGSGVDGSGVDGSVAAADGANDGDTSAAPDDALPPDATDGANSTVAASGPVRVRAIIGGGLRAGPTYRAALVVEAPLAHAVDTTGSYSVWMGTDPAGLDPAWSGP